VELLKKLFSIDQASIALAHVMFAASHTAWDILLFVPIEVKRNWQYLIMDSACECKLCS